MSQLQEPVLRHRHSQFSAQNKLPVFVTATTNPPARRPATAQRSATTHQRNTLGRVTHQLRRFDVRIRQIMPLLADALLADEDFTSGV